MSDQDGWSKPSADEAAEMAAFLETRAITPTEHDVRLAELQGRLAASRFLASITYFIVLGYNE